MTQELRPFRLGEIVVDPPIFLAPLAGYSDLPYRTICRRFGAPYCATEMVLDRCLLHKGGLTHRLVRSDQRDHPLAGQLIGNEPDTMARAAKLFCDAVGVDVVDLNFACPVRKALARRRGGHLMRQPELAVEIVHAVCTAVDRPVTVKVRRAFEADDRDHAAFYRIAEAAYDSGAAAVCVHARSVEQKYSGPADWEFLARAKEHFHDRVLLGSGDVLRPQKALDMLALTGADGVAVARGGLGNPWFWRQALDLAAGREPHRPTLTEQRTVLMDHFQLACEFYGPLRGSRIMRKFGIRYARLHPTPKRVRVAFIDVKKPPDWLRVLEELYPSPDAPAGAAETCLADKETP